MAKILAKCLLKDELMHPSDFLAAIELRGQDVTVRISKVEFEDLALAGGTKKERKPVISFEGKKKRFVCNKTNADSIAQMYGTKADEWVGKWITIYPTTTMVGRKKEPCIRVRESIPAGRGNAPPPASNPMGAGDDMGDEEKARIEAAEREGHE